MEPMIPTAGSLVEASRHRKKSRRQVSVDLNGDVMVFLPAIAAEMGVSQADWDQMGPQARRIIVDVLPLFVHRFVRKSLHYGPKNANVLGPAGQFADIWRKIEPLKRALWEGIPPVAGSEPPEEICNDLIGHLFLTIDMLAEEVDRRGTG
jgi:hypothetical protein